MNPRAAAYLRKHSRIITINGEAELILPLDRVQGFLDLLTPADVPPELLQCLYTAQAELVAAVRRQTRPTNGPTAEQPDQ